MDLRSGAFPGRSPDLRMGEIRGIQNRPADSQDPTPRREVSGEVDETGQWTDTSSSKESDMMDKRTDRQASRRAFLRSTGKTLAAAIGMAALPGIVRASGPSQPHATSGSSKPNTPLLPVTYHCYANAETCGIGCSDIQVRYRCKASGCTSYCTGCQTFTTYHEDYTFQVPSCL